MGLVSYQNKMGHYGCGMSLALMMMALVLIGVISIVGEAQTVPPSTCAEEISPCLTYLNSTKPPKSCCDPVKDVVATQFPCFCKFLLTPGILDSFGLNITMAIQFAHYCNVTINVTRCQAVMSAEPPSSPVQPQPAATPGDDKGGAVMLSFTGLSFTLLYIMLACWAYLMLN